MAKKKQDERIGLIGKFKQRESPSFFSFLGGGSSVPSVLASAVTESQRLTIGAQTETFKAAAREISDIGKVNPDVSLEAIKTIERMHQSVIFAQQKESKSAKKFAVFSVLFIATAAGSAGVYAYKTRPQSLNLPKEEAK